MHSTLVVGVLLACVASPAVAAGISAGEGQLPVGGAATPPPTEAPATTPLGAPVEASTPAAPAVSSPAAPAEPPRSYRSQVAIADAAGWAVVVGGGVSGNLDVIGLGAIALQLTAPMVHLVNAHPGRALGSFALRASGTVAGLLIGVAIADSDSGSGEEHWDTVAGGTLGGLVGLLVGELIDAKIPIGSPGKWKAVPGESREQSAVVIVPVVAPARHGGLLGVAAVF